MTCGIYILNFNGTSKVYVGQSQNIETRYLQHLVSMKNGTANTKLLEAYQLYGAPTYTIVAECSIGELGSLEEEAIDIWDSVSNGFNIYQYANQAPLNREYGSCSCKYLKTEIIEVFKLLIYSDMSFKEIEDITRVKHSTVANIAAIKSHIWLKEEFPSEYQLLCAKKESRRSIISNSVLSNKLSAKAKGIVYPKIKDPLGNIYTIDNAYKFAKQHGLAPNHFQEVLNGHRKSHKGWKVCPEEPR